MHRVIEDTHKEDSNICTPSLTTSKLSVSGSLSMLFSKEPQLDLWYA